MIIVFTHSIWNCCAFKLRKTSSLRMSATLNFSVCRLILQRISYRSWHLTDLESRKVVQIHFVKRCTFRDNWTWKFNVSHWECNGIEIIFILKPPGASYLFVPSLLQCMLNVAYLHDWNHDVLTTCAFKREMD